MEATEKHIALREFLAGIHCLLKEFDYDDLIKLHEVIYNEINRRMRDIGLEEELFHGGH